MFEGRAKAAAFFREVSQDRRCENTAVIVVTHLVPGREVFLNAVADIARVAAVIPKPNSIDEHTLRVVQKHQRVVPWTRQDCSNTNMVVPAINELVYPGERLVFLDMGGYFAAHIEEMASAIQAQLVGVVEDTENGHQRYERVSSLPCPVISAARSELKEPEDFLIGQSVVFSAEALLRECELIFANKRVLVIGFGKLGRSIADSLSRRSITTQVYDMNPTRQVYALSQGYNMTSLDHALRNADVIFCATGNKALQQDDYAKLKPGCYVATVTSADDELEMAGLRANRREHVESTSIQRYEAQDQYFYLLNQGNAINFIHHAVVGPYIYLIQAELLRDLQFVVQGGLTNHVLSLPAQEKACIAKTWLRTYNGGYHERYESH